MYMVTTEDVTLVGLNLEGGGSGGLFFSGSRYPLLGKTGLGFSYQQGNMQYYIDA
jgi:hypothetical protein